MPRTGMKGFELCPHTCAPTGHCVNRSQTPLWRIEGGSLRRHLKGNQHPRCSTSCPAYGVKDFHPVERMATPAHLQLYIPTVRRLRTISDQIISRALTLHPSEVANRFPVDTNEETAEDIEAQEKSNLNAYIPGRGDIEGRMDDHQLNEVDVNNSQHNRMNDASHTFTNRAHSLVPDVSVVSENSQFTDLFTTPQLLPEIRNRPLIQKTFRVLYVPDPSRHAPMVHDTRIDLSFTTRTITKQQFQNASSMFPDLIVNLSQGRQNGWDVVKARLSDWVRYTAIT